VQELDPKAYGSWRGPEAASCLCHPWSDPVIQQGQSRHPLFSPTTSGVFSQSTASCLQSIWAMEGTQKRAFLGHRPLQSTDNCMEESSPICTGWPVKVWAAALLKCTVYLPVILSDFYRRGPEWADLKQEQQACPENIWTSKQLITPQGNPMLPSLPHKTDDSWLFLLRKKSQPPVSSIISYQTDIIWMTKQCFNVHLKYFSFLGTTIMKFLRTCSC
jgi:hypothetical protein